jgi:hypothetical protein
MAFGREHEIARPSAVPEWLRQFAEDALRRSADGSNPFQEIRSLFQRNKELGAIEARVRELKDRIGLGGLGLLAEHEATAAEPVPVAKAASLAHARPSAVARLARLANWLDGQGLEGEAREVDGVIRARAAEDVFARYPKLKAFVDNVIRSRGGHVTVPAILKMIRDERPKESAAAPDAELRRYVEGRIREEKRDVDDASDNIAGFGVGLSTSWEDLRDDNRMFEPSKPAG